MKLSINVIFYAKIFDFICNKAITEDQFTELRIYIELLHAQRT